MRRVAVATAVVVVALAPAARLAWLSRDGPHLGFYHDDGVYWVTAKSIAAGGGYRIPSLPGEPHQTKYPPVFPALLALAWRIQPEFPANLATTAWIVGLPFPLLLLLSNALFAQWGIGGRTRVLLCAATALNAYLAFFSTVLMAENWAACFVVAALVLAGRSAKSWWEAPLSGVLAAAAYLTKTMVAPLLAAVPAALWWRRERRAAALFLAAAVPLVLPWHLWAAAHRGPATDSTWLYYLDYLGYYRSDVTPAVLPLFVYRNLGELFNAGGDLLIFKLSALPWGIHPARLVMFAAMAGIFRRARADRRWEYPLFAALQFIMLLPWNGGPNERFLISLFPLLILGLWTEAGNLGRLAVTAWRRPEVSQRVAAALAGAVLAVLAAGLAARNLHALWIAIPALGEARREAARQAEPLYGWIRAHTPAAATFWAERDTTLYLRTGRHATTRRGLARYFYLEDRAAILAESAKLGPFALARRLDYVLLTPADFTLDPLPEDERRAAREALAREARFRAVYESPAGTILKVDHGGE
jgi:hypothetical protein